MSTIRVTINGVDLDAPQGQTILQVASKHGVSIPTFCYHEQLSIAANCRMCLVEIAGAPKLLPACQTEIREGMKISTESDRVKDWQKRNLEFMLLHHPVDCPICDAAGDCKLQDLYYAYDKEKSRLWSYGAKLHKSKRKVFGPNVIYDGERCILCTLCIRFCEEVWGEHLLDSRLRGNQREIIVAEGESLDFPYSLMTVNLCPVGALTNRHFRFKKRCWFLVSMPGICPGCATGCAAVTDHEDGTIYRMRPRFDNAVNKCWLCDEGVLSGELHNRNRISNPSVKRGKEREKVPVRDALSRAASILSNRDRDKTGVVMSAECTCEENHALLKFTEALGAKDNLYIEGRTEGEEDRLLRHKDKNPNRAGAMKVARMQRIPGRKELLGDLKAGKIKTLIALGGEGPGEGEIPADTAIVCLAARSGGMTEAAGAVLPAPSFAETSGRYINSKDMVRSFNISIKSWGRLGPPPQVWETLKLIAEGMGNLITLGEKEIRKEVTRLVGDDK